MDPAVRMALAPVSYTHLGNVMLTERDEFIYDEMIVHVPMAVHKQAKDILVIGAGDGGVVRELSLIHILLHMEEPIRLM